MSKKKKQGSDLYYLEQQREQEKKETIEQMMKRKKDKERKQRIEEKKKQDKAEELINNAVVAMMIQNGNGDVGTKLTHLAVLGKCIDDVAELLECSRLEVMQFIRQKLMMLNPFMVNPMFDDETLKRNHMYRKKKTVTRQFEKETSDYRPVKNDKNETGGQYGSHTPTFGDAFSSLLELKEKLEK